MKRKMMCLMGIVLTIIIGLTSLYAQAPKDTKPKGVKVTTLLPASLDNFFPPKAAQPVYLFRMLGMAKPLSGIMADLSENDFANVLANFERFKTQYSEVSKLIPEWEEHFPAAPVNDLGVALQSGDQGKVRAAFAAVGKVCADCHSSNQSKAYYKYHWGDFHGIKIQDPLSRQEVNFQQFMLFLDGSFTGIEIDVEQGQIENARRHLQGFRARMEALGEACMNCHDTERHYYVDEGIKTRIDELGQALQASPVDPKRVSNIAHGIGLESCFKCHLVHVPAAAAHARKP